MEPTYASIGFWGTALDCQQPTWVGAVQFCYWRRVFCLSWHSEVLPRIASSPLGRRRTRAILSLLIFVLCTRDVPPSDFWGDGGNCETASRQVCCPGKIKCDNPLEVLSCEQRVLCAVTQPS